jgi:hypothetical protein
MLRTLFAERSPTISINYVFLHVILLFLLLLNGYLDILPSNTPPDGGLFD